MQTATDENYATYLMFATIKPDPILSVSEWADQYRYLSQKASAEPGKYRTERTPFMREIMDTLSTSNLTKEIVFMKASQIGATEAGTNWLGYVMDHSPGPILLVWPTVDMAKKNSRQRIEPLIDESPRLAGKVSQRRSKDSANTMLTKDFPGGTLAITGANSSSGLRSMPAKYLFLDEVDAYPIDVEGEGNPIDLAKARARTFSKRKIFTVSTPTIEGTSHIARLFSQSDQRYYQVPCPHCDQYQVLMFKGLEWPENKPEKARFLCENCRKPIENWQKTEMLRRGRWVKTAESDVAGFHLNALYSPVGWYSWGEIASDFVKAKTSPETLRSFVNTVLGETWKEKAERPEYQRLYERRENYPTGRVPNGVAFLTCGVDVQKDRLEAEIVGWGKNKVSWSIDYRVIHGDTSDQKTWTKLDALLSETFPTCDNDKIRLPIKLTAIDSGYNTQQVYTWCRKYSQTKVIPIKGRDNLGMVFSRPLAVDVMHNGKSLRRGLRVWTVGTNVIKSELYGWLRQVKGADVDDPIGYCHFPQYDDEFFKQLTAEEIVTKFVKGYKHTEWQKIRDRNEALDARVYARAAASICGIDRMSDDSFKKLEQQSQTVNTPIVTPLKPQAPKPIERRKSGWL